MNEELTKIASLIAERVPVRSYPVYGPDDVLNNEEAAAVLHCTVEAIGKYVTLKGLPYYKAGISRLFIYSDIINWLKNNRDMSNEIVDAYRNTKPVTELLRKSKTKSKK